MKKAIFGIFTSGDHTGSPARAFSCPPDLKAFTLFLTVLVLACTGLAAGEGNIIAANPSLIGKWTGEGKFLDVAMDKEFGAVPLTVEINRDGTIAGRIGDATLTQTSLHKARYGFEIHGILDSRVRKDKAEKKDHLIILLVSPSKDKDGVLVSDANFHLKSNYTFDLTMRVGEIGRAHV